MYCPNCGQQQPNSVKVCGDCGYRFGRAISNQRAAPPQAVASPPVIVIHDRGGSGGLWIFLTIVLILGLLLGYGVIEIPDGMQAQISRIGQNLVNFVQASQPSGGSDSGVASVQSSSGSSAGQANQNNGANDQTANEGEPEQGQPAEEEEPPSRDGIIEVQPEAEEPPARDGVIEVQPEPFSFTFQNSIKNYDDCVYALFIRPVGSSGDWDWENNLIDAKIPPNGSATITIPSEGEMYEIAVILRNCEFPGSEVTYFETAPLKPGVTYPFRPEGY